MGKRKNKGSIEKGDLVWVKPLKDAQPSRIGVVTGLGIEFARVLVGGELLFFLEHELELVAKDSKGDVAGDR